MKVIDAHTHLLHNPVGLDKIVESGEFEEIWIMDLSGVRLNGYELATQQEIIDVMKRYPGFYRAFGFIDLDRDTPDKVRKLKDLGFCGLKPYKQLKPYNDPAYFPIYQAANDEHMPILFHTGLIAHAPAYDGKMKYAFGPENMRPSYLASIAEAFPDLQIIGGHLGWPWLEETKQNLYFYKNITGDTSGYRNCFDVIPQLFDMKAHDGTTRFFNQKFHFATDEFYGSKESNEHGLKLKKFWELYFELIGDIYYRWGSAEEKKKFFRDNALEILKSC